MKKVITYGSFDLFHEGHYNLLRRAKELGDYLIVGVTTEHYDESRGKLNVIDPLITRMENVKKCGFADQIIEEDHEGQKISDIQKYNADIFTVGSDWIGRFDYLKEYCQVVYLPRTEGVSSTMLRNDRIGILRLGIAGTGRIASRFAKDMKYVSGVSSSCVFNPDKSQAESFAKKYGQKAFSNNYDTFLDEVDAVYIATPHETHYQYIKSAIQAGKHVLCETPMVLFKTQAEELAALAHDRHVVLMEAVKTAFFPAFINLLAIAKSGRIGKICDVEATFTKLLPNPGGSREFTPETGGSFSELAGFTLLPVLKLLGSDYKELRFESIADENGLDIYTKAHFNFSGAMATAKTGLGVKSEGQLLISGTKGYILVPSPWWLTKSFQVCYENVKNNEMFHIGYSGYGLRYELADFVKAISNPSENSFKFPSSDSAFIAGVIEEFLAQRNSSL